MPTLGRLFLVFLKIGSLAFGGAYGMLAFFQRELVDRRRWLREDELAEGVAIGQVTPGPPIVNTGIFVGYRLRGAPGAVVVTLGQVLPGFVLVVALAALYRELRSVPLLASALKGVGAAVVGLLGSVVLGLGRKEVDGPPPAALAFASFALLSLGRANPALLVAAAGLAGLLLFRRGR